MTLNGVMTVILLFFDQFRSFLGPITSKWSKIDLHSLRRKSSPNNLVFSEISFIVIFPEVTENEGIIERHLRDIHPLLDMTRLKVSLYALGLIDGFSVRP